MPSAATLSRTSEVTLTGHAKVIQDIGWSCDGKRLATASGDTSARVWTVDSHREGRELELKDHTQSVEGVSWHPTQAETLATISTDKTIRIWDIRGKKSVAIATPEEIINIKYSPSGDYIAISDKNETVRLVDTRKNKVIAQYALPTSFWVNELAWSQSGDALLLANGRQSSLEKGLVDVVRVDTAKGELKAMHTVVSAAANCMCIAMDATGKYFATGSYDGITCLWDAADLACLRPCCKSLEEPIGSLSFSYDGVYIAGACDIEPRNTTARKLIDICEVCTGNTVLKLDAESTHSRSAEKLAGRDKEIKVTGGQPRKLAWHPSQYVLAYGCEKMTIEEKDMRGYDQRGGSSTRTEVPVVVTSLTQK